MAALLIGGVALSVVFFVSGLQNKGATVTAQTVTSETMRQAAYILSTEAADTDADGQPEPPIMALNSNGTGNCATTTEESTAACFIPSTSAAPKNDAWGKALFYCAWDHGTTNASTARISGTAAPTQAIALFAVISAGPNKTVQTTCTQAKAGQVTGDDLVRSITLAQKQQGTGGTMYYGDAVANYAALPASGNTTGTMRVTLDTGRTFVWNGTAWIPTAADQNGNMVLTGAVQVNSGTAIATSGADCSTYGPGYLARDSSGDLYICK